MTPLQRLEWCLFRIKLISVGGNRATAAQHREFMRNEIVCALCRLRRRIGLWIAGAE